MQMKSILLLVVCVLFLASFVSGCNRSTSSASSTGGEESIESIKNKMPNEWPSLVGKKAEEAKKLILSERPELKVFILPQDSMMTMDYREDRVRIFVDDNEIVIKPPKIG